MQLAYTEKNDLTEISAAKFEIFLRKANQQRAAWEPNLLCALRYHC